MPPPPPISPSSGMTVFTNPFYEMEEEEKKATEVERKRQVREDLGASASGDPDAKVWGGTGGRWSASVRSGRILVPLPQETLMQRWEEDGEGDRCMGGERKRQVREDPSAQPWYSFDFPHACTYLCRSLASGSASRAAPPPLLPPAVPEWAST